LRAPRAPLISRASPAPAAPQRKNPGRAARGMEIAKIDESVDQKLTRTPPVKAVLFTWSNA
jgi:hypothetical protein